MLRVWLEEPGDGQQEWRGAIQHLASPETQYFRDWTEMMVFVRAQLHNAPEDEV